MAICERLRNRLTEDGTPYEVLTHREVFTAQEVAQSAHVPGRELAKVVVLRDADGAHLLAVIPASKRLDLDRAHRVTGRSGLAFASEDDMKRLFPDCQVGAMPPFGKLYGLPMFVDPCLLEDHTIYFQAGNHCEVVGMPREDFEHLERPFFSTGCLHPAAEPAHA